jgi:coenzyme F420-0:L-glutamate ligase/coenzyme F420-1:gamma-L-glutamate ligase
MQLTITTLQGIPEIQPGNNLVDIFCLALRKNQLLLADGDIVVIAQKIVSKAEGRFVNLESVVPGKDAIKLAKEIEKDVRLVELILSESNEVLRTRPGTIIVEHKSGFVCANAGIDHSNVFREGGDPDLWYLLLPEDSDRSANLFRDGVKDQLNVDIGVMIIDSHGRAWRNGTVGTVIGLCGVPGVVDMRGKLDMYGYKLQNTIIAAADELAGSASLMMGQANEKSPMVVVKGFPYSLRTNASVKEVIRPRDQDLFR